MKRKRREILQMVPLVIGAGVVFGANESAIGARAQSSEKKPRSGHEADSAGAEKVDGIGGFFFVRTIPKGWASGIRNISVCLLFQRAMTSSLGDRRLAQLRSLHSLRQPSILAIPRSSG